MTSNKEPRHTHDKGYKQLLSNKRAFLELIKTFVREDWVKEIDEGDLVKVDKSYVYNGAGRWTASTNFKEMLSGYEKFQKHILNFSYILFNVNRYTRRSYTGWPT